MNFLVTIVLTLLRMGLWEHPWMEAVIPSPLLGKIIIA